MLSNLFLKRHAPRWFIFMLDAFISGVSIILAFHLRFNFDIPAAYWNNLWYIIILMLFIRSFTFVIYRTYAGIIRYTSTKDTERIIIVVVVGSTITAIINALYYNFFYQEILIPYSVLIIDALLTAFSMVALRLLVKAIYAKVTNTAGEKRSVIIYGAEKFGSITKRSIDRDINNTFKVVAFIDDEGNIGKKLDGVNVYSTEALEEIIEKYAVANLIIAKNNIDKNKQDEVVDKCLKQQIKVLRVPEVSDWINEELNINQIRNMRIEDLLGRDTIKLDENRIIKETTNKIVLVTGAAGSIGSGLVRQLARYNPKKIILVDQAETPLYDVELEIKEKLGQDNHAIEIADITNHRRMKEIFERHQPAIVYHAAAYKHVPMMEEHPAEAVNNNILGTKILADLTSQYKARKFVMISTDKAVNPTNVMGASKRIAEIYTQSLNSKSTTKFITTRFGNVLGSNGSVIPRFKSQIEGGGPVTVTDSEVTRYFMTIPEACQLVLEASAFGKGGEIFVFDMGKAVRIVDLAKRMIRLSGYKIQKDISIKFTGLRPGEKLYEELLNTQENTMPTHHPQIMIGKVREYNFEFINKEISHFYNILEKNDKQETVKQMKKIVPEFRSQNSAYQRLDYINAYNENVSMSMHAHAGES